MTDDPQRKAHLEILPGDERQEWYGRLLATLCTLHFVTTTRYAQEDAQEAEGETVGEC